MSLPGLVSTFNANAVAHSAAERFALLEERDKFLRSSMPCTFGFNTVVMSLHNNLCMFARLTFKGPM